MDQGQERTPVTHALQTNPAEFAAVVDGRKRFEWCPTGRDFRVGDMLRLMEWDPVFEAYTGSWAMVTVLYVCALPGGTIVSISPLLVNWRDDQRLMSVGE